MEINEFRVRMGHLCASTTIMNDEDFWTKAGDLFEAVLAERSRKRRGLQVAPAPAHEVPLTPEAGPTETFYRNGDYVAYVYPHHGTPYWRVRFERPSLNRTGTGWLGGRVSAYDLRMDRAQAEIAATAWVRSRVLPATD